MGSLKTPIVVSIVTVAVIAIILSVHFLNPDSRIFGGRDTTPGAATQPAALQAEPASSQAQPSSLPPGTPLTYTDVIESWRQSAQALRLSPADTDQIAGWLRRVLIRPHRRIDEESIAIFQESLRHFGENSGADFVHADRHRASLDLLRFCSEAGWTRSVDNEDMATVLATYDKFTEEVVQRIKEEMKSSIPPEKMAEWQIPVNSALEKLTRRINEHVRALNADFLFPGFKEPLTGAARAEVLQEMEGWDLIPKYGDVRKQALMQTRDEAFGNQIERGLPFFDMEYTNTLSWYSVRVAFASDKYWQNYGCSFSGSYGLWPFKMVMRLDVTTKHDESAASHGN